MDNNLLRDESISQQNELDSQDRIFGWLKRLEHEEEYLKPNLRQGCSYVKGSQSERDETPPTTPDRRQDGSFGVEEVSPISTSFSSIFDRPPIPVPAPSLCKQATSHPSANDRDDCVSDASATTNWDEEDKQAKPTCKEQVDLEPFTPHKADYVFDEELDQSCNEAASGFATCSTVSPRPLSPLNSRPRHVFITSCYQCVLAGMSCSRTPPACSRCERNGYGDLCLLHRRKLTREMIAGDTETNRMPVLLRTKGIDDGKGWERKLELLHELQQLHLDQQDRKNWVLPSVDGRRGGFRTHAQRQSIHPGEGIGRQTFRELTLG